MPMKQRSIFDGTTDNHNANPNANLEGRLIQFFVPGIPVAQPRQRSRVIEVGGRAMAANYTPTNSPVNAFKAAVRLAWPKAEPFRGAVAVDAEFYFPRPKSKTRKTNATEPKTSKPDIDNLFKSMADALTGLAWNDDAQVSQLAITKSIVGDGQLVGVGVVIREVVV